MHYLFIMCYLQNLHYFEGGRSRKEKEDISLFFGHIVNGIKHAYNGMWVGGLMFLLLLPGRGYPPVTPLTCVKPYLYGV
jgi:hypothetical protein